MTEPIYTANIISHISEVGAKDWDALIPSGRHPFLSHRFLFAMEESGSAVPETGWAPRHIWVEDATGKAVGAAPLYVKSHSRGEYVFDHAWANALMRAGMEYYPKLQCSVPFTPATGPRLLAKSPEAKQAVAGAMMQACTEWGLSGVHVTFLESKDRKVLADLGFAAREDRQFHFINRDYDNFDGFLASLSSRKRKNIRKERQAAQDGVKIERLMGDDLKSEHWDLFFQCYLDTSNRKWGQPYLTRKFFDIMQHTMRDDICLILASQDGTPIAAALNYIGSEALYGRNWGALIHKPFLHFELCYYQAIETGLDLGLSRVEAGAQGEHKLARGYEPVVTHSAHWLSHPGLMQGVENFLEHERAAIEHEVEILGKHTPFRKG